MIRREEVYPIGKIGKPHGVAGDVNFLFEDDVFDRDEAEYLILEVDGILVPFFMEEYRFRSDTTAIVHFEDIDSQEKARALTGCNVFYPRSDVSTDSEYTWNSLIGFTIEDAQTARVYGAVQAIDTSTINVLFVLTTAEGSEALVPANEELIEAIDPERRTIVMNLPEGLLDD